MKKMNTLSLACLAGFISACAASETSTSVKRVQPADEAKIISRNTDMRVKTYDVANHVKLASLRTEIPKEIKNTRSVKKPLVTYTHEVSAGETTYSLSQKYCSHVEDIKSVNALNADYKINTGQFLLIPRTRC